MKKINAQQQETNSQAGAEQVIQAIEGFAVIAERIERAVASIEELKLLSLNEIKALAESKKAELLSIQASGTNTSILGPGDTSDELAGTPPGVTK